MIQRVCWADYTSATAVIQPVTCVTCHASLKSNPLLFVCSRLKEPILFVELLNTWHQILSEGVIQDMTRYVLLLILFCVFP